MEAFRHFLRSAESIFLRPNKHKVNILDRKKLKLLQTCGILLNIEADEQLYEKRHGVYY